ncbi:ankyrin repeat domain-containing protein [Altericroceibacterium spongiae]|uniref:Ankyrin repeat domain-containing protein n=2 Tax=Altericroceibacterium spongiae TaxID=2320269 RepID=A0A420EJI1_9SPHN|nr:ankyrin repeat domain-containing protein [Altericroceibacterium spongiae]
MFSDGYKFLEAVKKKDGTEVTQMLDKPGSTLVNSRDLTTGDSALHMVTARRDLTWIRFLLGKGANPNIRNKKGETPLMIASQLGFTDGVEALAKAGAQVDNPNAAGETPLIAAVHRRDLSMMRVLLKAGANPDRNDNSGRSAMDYARLAGAGQELIDVIERNAKPENERENAGVTYGPRF